MGNWVDGKQCDSRVYVLPNDAVRKGNWEEGRRVGEWSKLTEEEQNMYRAELRRVKHEINSFAEKRDALAQEIEVIKEYIMQKYAEHQEGGLQKVLGDAAKRCQDTMQAAPSQIQ